MKSVRTSILFLNNIVSSIQGLAPITNPLNSVLVEKKLINVDQKFIQLFLWQKGYLVQKLLKVVEIIGEVFVEA